MKEEITNAIGASNPPGSAVSLHQPYWKKLTKMGRRFEKRRDNPDYIDGRSKAARKLLSRLSKSKKMSEETTSQVQEESGNPKGSGGENTAQAYKQIAQKRKVLKKQEREKRGANRKKEIEIISRAKAADYAKKAKDRVKKLGQDMRKQSTTQASESFEGSVYLESLLEQVNSENQNSVFYFFNDDSEIELTSEQAKVLLGVYESLSEENKEIFLSLLPESGEFLIDFLQLAE